MAQLRFTLEAPFSALLFDCDGTLVDTARAHLAAYNRFLAGFDSEMPWEWYSTRLGIPAGALLMLFAEQNGLRYSHEEAVHGHTSAYEDGFDSIREIEAVAEVARAFQGKVPMAVVSNGMRSGVEGSLRGAGLIDLFDSIVTIEDVKHGKPAPDIYLEAARRLGVAAEGCVVFEDSDEGLEAARRAGMRSHDVRLVTLAGR